MLNGMDYLLAALAALAAGAVNAIAGGGTLITFPTLTFLGVPGVIANVTNTVALCPGYFGGTMAQRGDLQTQKRRLWLVLPAGVLGGVIGGYLLLQTGERLFKGQVLSSLLRTVALQQLYQVSGRSTQAINLQNRIS